jgi:hypothetical protein
MGLVIDPLEALQTGDGQEQLPPRKPAHEQWKTWQGWWWTANQEQAVNDGPPAPRAESTE